MGGCGSVGEGGAVLGRPWQCVWEGVAVFGSVLGDGAVFWRVWQCLGSCGSVWEAVQVFRRVWLVFGRL